MGWFVVGAYPVNVRALEVIRVRQVKPEIELNADALTLEAKVETSADPGTQPGVEGRLSGGLDSYLGDCGAASECTALLLQREADSSVVLASDVETQPSGADQDHSAFAIANATIEVSGQRMALRNGTYEAPAGIGGVRQVRIVGRPASGRIDGVHVEVATLSDRDGDGDSRLYLVALLNGQKATPCLLLGIRLSFQSIAIDGKTIVVTYVRAAADEKASLQPTVERFTIVDGALKSGR